MNIIADSQNMLLLAAVLSLSRKHAMARKVNDERLARSQAEQRSGELRRQVATLEADLEAEKVHAKEAISIAAAKATEIANRKAETELELLRQANTEMGETLAQTLGGTDLTDVANGASRAAK